MEARSADVAAADCGVCEALLTLQIIAAGLPDPQHRPIRRTGCGRFAAAVNCAFPVGVLFSPSHRCLAVAPINDC